MVVRRAIATADLKNPFCGEGAIHICPDSVYDNGAESPSPSLEGAIMHELSHNCGVGEHWAYPIGDMFSGN
jgi:hypothetical protein